MNNFISKAPTYSNSNQIDQARKTEILPIQSRVMHEHFGNPGRESSPEGMGIINGAQFVEADRKAEGREKKAKDTRNPKSTRRNSLQCLTMPMTVVVTVPRPLNASAGLG